MFICHGACGGMAYIATQTDYVKGATVVASIVGAGWTMLVVSNAQHWYIIRSLFFRKRSRKILIANKY